uniref:Uncharacterized protein n=1 Tax=Cacopsylla melanoneura TaxID=428564 RepID=A0A8D8Y8K8_9HEMI
MAKQHTLTQTIPFASLPPPVSNTVVFFSSNPFYLKFPLLCSLFPSFSSFSSFFLPVHPFSLVFSLFPRVCSLFPFFTRFCSLFPSFFIYLIVYRYYLSCL